MKQISASLKYIKGSCYKFNGVAQLIRGLSVVDADMQLAFCEKRCAIPIRKLLKSAVANAENRFKIAKNNLYVTFVEVGKAFVLKRSMPRGRGRMTRIEKRYTSMKIVLCEKNLETKKVVKKVSK